ncbi:Fis family transcriptional regulator [bacterium CG_4_9_14_3_um_filter_65_15]|nr:MAG: Fis family transcriptional regulator [bacterium CG_4_9_14_3_um_filter_65_15]
MSRIPRLLIVDDELHVRESLSHWFTEDGYDVETANGGHEALAALGRKSFDVIISDIKMPGMDGLELQRRVHEKDPNVAIVLVTAYASVDTAVQALKEGAYDYLVKPFDPEELSKVVAKACEKASLTKENTALKEKLAQSGPTIVTGSSPGMQKVMELAEMVAPTETSVLIRGESGTGKELIARLIHMRSGRSFGPMVAVNCGALQESILESELFGHEKGAFTGAVNRRKGKLELADGGTLFLDEIGDISPKVQVELLRSLEDHKITRLGGGQEIPVDFRLICATNKDLDLAVEDGSFRDDLFFRINVFGITIPPLRDRPEDILPIADHFLQRYAGAMGRRVTGYSSEVKDFFMSYRWPGNVRELANAVERSLVVCRDTEIQLDHLPLVKRSGDEIDGEDSQSLSTLEEKHVRRILKQTSFNVTQAAKILGIDRVTLYNKMRKFGIERE